jgi:hypothetical protein
MRKKVAIENIDEMRRQAGIDDVELREAIRHLKVGDAIKLTLVARSGTSETLRVRITRIQGTAFRGKLTGKPASVSLSGLRDGSPVVFTTVHIHSIANKGKSV